MPGISDNGNSHDVMCETTGAEVTCATAFFCACTRACVKYAKSASNLRWDGGWPGWEEEGEIFPDFLARFSPFLPSDARSGNKGAGTFETLLLSGFETK